RRSTGHRHDEVGEQRPQGQVLDTRVVRDDRAVREADDRIVLQDAAVAVEQLARFERDGVHPALRTGQLYAVARAERPGAAWCLVHRPATSRWSRATAMTSSTVRPSSDSQSVCSVDSGNGTMCG